MAWGSYGTPPWPMLRFGPYAGGSTSSPTSASIVGGYVIGVSRTRSPGVGTTEGRWSPDSIEVARTILVA